MLHVLKTVQPYFEALWSGEKRFEVRKNDRGFQVGDSLCLREYISGIAIPENPRQATILFAQEPYLVDIAWAMGNARRLPDMTNPAQMAEALALSHPAVLGVGAKYPPRNE